MNKEGGDGEVYFEVGTSFLLACSKIQRCDSDLIYIIVNTVTKRVEMENVCQDGYSFVYLACCIVI